MGEEVLFCERSKLFCFDKDSKEWKERANGYLKILRNSTSGKVGEKREMNNFLSIATGNMKEDLRGIKVY